MDKVLFIVDIQEKYRNSFRNEYLDKVKQYLNTNRSDYKHIVMIMEENTDCGDFISKEINQELTIRPVFKCYDAEYSYNKLKESVNFSIIDGKLIPKINFPNGDFCFQEGSGFIVGTKEDDKIYIDYMGRDLYLLLNLFRNYEIDIIGGGLNHCVKKTQEYFRFIGISNTKIKTELCYNISVQSKPCDDKYFDLFIENKKGL